jgi:hypothetical protein
MNTTINAVIAEERAADLRRAATRPPEPWSLVQGRVSRIELRLADHDDADVLWRLAALDDARELEGPVLLAFIDGDAVAGLSLRDRRVVANPFVPTVHAVALMRLRSEHLSSAPVRRRRIRLPRLRLA